MRDEHFSIISKALELFRHKEKRGLINSHDVVNALNTSYIYNKKNALSKSICLLFNPDIKENRFISSKLEIKIFIAITIF